MSALSIQIGGTESELMSLPDGSWSHQQCELAPGEYTPVVIAVNHRGARTVKQGEAFTVAGCEGHAPDLSISASSVQGDCIHLQGTAQDADGDDFTLTLAIDADAPTTLAVAPNGGWSHDRCELSQGLHTVVATAVDATGLRATAQKTFRVHAEENNHPPEVLVVGMGVRDDCVSLDGTALDPDGDALSMRIFIDGQSEAVAAPDGLGHWSHSHCGLEPGDHEAVVTAEDGGGLKDSTRLQFRVDAEAGGCTTGGSSQAVLLVAMLLTAMLWRRLFA
jgi:hypothetical protein